MSPRKALATLIACCICLAMASWAFAKDKEVDLGIITVKQKKLAEDLRQRLIKGEGFEALAKKHSVSPTASRGGRLGMVPLKRLRVEFRNAVKDLPVGQPSSIIPTEEGYNLLMRFGAAKKEAAAPEAEGEERFLQARQRNMAGLEALSVGELKTAESNFSRSLGLNPREESTAFFLQIAREALAGKVNKKAAMAFGEGFLALLQADPKKALQLFQKARTLDMGLWQASLFEANMMASLGQTDHAKKLLDKIVAEQPRVALAHVSLGVMARDAGQVEESRRQFRQALTINPDLAEAHYNLGALDLAEGKFKSAERSLRKAIISDPYLDEAYSDLGLALAYQGQFAEAEKNYIKTLELNPNYAAAHLNLGTLYAQQKKYNQAIDEFNKALQVDANLADAHSNLAAAYVIKGEWARAMSHADRAKAMGFPVPKPILDAIEPHRKKETK